MKPIPKLLSKTKLMRGFRCHKSIYLTIHHSEFEAPITPDQQALFDQGNLVGEEARKKFPGGILVDAKPWDFWGSLKKTKELLAQHTGVIFEAAFEFQGTYARADVIEHNPESKRWKVYEVKSSTKVKDEQLQDVALQAWIMAKSGLPIEQIHVMHINPECRYPNLDNLFVKVDVTEKMREIYPNILPEVGQIYSLLAKPSVPNIPIGSHCENPNECGFKKHCFQEARIPEFSVLNLPGLREKKWEYLKGGKIEVESIDGEELNELQKRIIEVTKTHRPYIDKEGIRNAISSWQYPLVFLDFETIGPAIPRYLGTKPFQQVPFQFSVHRLLKPDAILQHYEYLHTDSSDPRPLLIDKLLEACGDQGSIVSYFAKFESSRIEEMAEFSPEHRQNLLSLIERMVDPLDVLRDHVYDEKFLGSFSLKKTAPALLGSRASYEQLEVDNGTAAQRAFEKIINPQTTPEQREKLIKACLAYCGQDTLVMVELFRWFLREISSSRTT